jgi:cytochrome c oxidase subunit 4
VNELRSRLKTLLAVWGALLILLLITCGSAYIPLGPFNPAINLAVSVAKTMLVMLFFMQIRFASRAIKIAAAAGFFWLLLLVSLLLSDVLTRFGASV